MSDLDSEIQAFYKEEHSCDGTDRYCHECVDALIEREADTKNKLEAAERDLDFKTSALADKSTYVLSLEESIRTLREALEKISRSAPCKENHKSFNTPGQPCDQRIATEAIKSIGEEK